MCHEALKVDIPPLPLGVNAMKKVRGAAVAFLLILAGCDGPQEQAGEEADAASGAVGNEDTLRSGPAESLGELADEAQESAEEAAEAQAQALEKEADAARDAAEQSAAALEQEADTVRGN